MSSQRDKYKTIFLIKNVTPNIYDTLKHCDHFIPREGFKVEIYVTIYIPK